MFEIYRRKYNGKDKLVLWVECFNDIHLYAIKEYAWSTFGHKPQDITTEDQFHWDYSDFYIKDYDNKPHSRGYTTRHVYVAYQDGTLVTPDTLVGWYRERCRAEKTLRCRLSQRRRGAYGGLRRLRTFSERKWACAHANEYKIRIRGRRNAKGLPDPWDDYWFDGQKSWKRQSKRSKQWKCD